MNIVLINTKYNMFLYLKSKYTKAYAASTDVSTLNTVTVAAMKNVFPVIFAKDSLLNT